MAKALKQEAVTRHDLDEYLNFRKELWKHEIPVDDTTNFLLTLKAVRRLGFDSAIVVSKHRDLEQFEAGKIVAEELRKQVDHLKQEHAYWQEAANYYRLAVSKCQDLEEKLIWSFLCADL